MFGSIYVHCLTEDSKVNAIGQLTCKNNKGVARKLERECQISRAISLPQILSHESGS